jgi:hypothetical protein
MQTYGQVPYKRDRGLLNYQFPMLTNYPPTSLNMPYDVIMAYTYGDLLAQNYYMDQADSIATVMTYSDTLKEAARYLYEIDDYDPITYFQWRTTGPMGRYKQVGPSCFDIDLKERIMKVFPDNQVTATCLWSDYISDVIVNYTIEGIDSGAAINRNEVKVSCTVLDTIKGKRFPDCILDNNDDANRTKNEAKNIMLSPLGACLQFTYCLGWNRLEGQSDFNIVPDSTTLGDINTGRRWIQSGSEYIIFLAFSRTGWDGTYTHCDLFPNPGNGKCYGMYPVINGHVYDPYNDFGIGVGLTVAQFKAALRQKIYSITHP